MFRMRAHPEVMGRSTPAVAYTTRPKAAPGDRSADTHYRVRHDPVDTGGNATPRVHGQLHHTGIGRRLSGPRSSWRIADVDVPIIDAAPGELFRAPPLDPPRHYHGTG